uniref:Uncharacterized protein n=2 Tax=Callorhinchus milii TaxID=7868 RepID=A0A4W3H6J0_CALMI
MKSYNPEQIMLSAAVRRSSRELNIMKEKLIFAEINNGVSSCDDGSFCSDSGFDGYSNQGIGPLGQREHKSLQN